MHDQSSAPSERLSPRQQLAVICLDVAVLAEVAFSVYRASLDPEFFTPVFLKVFFSMLIPTCIIGVGAIRVFRPRQNKAAA